MSMQWQVSTNGGSTFTDIPGATGPTLTIINAGVAENQRQYRVIFSNPISIATSSAATLIVLVQSGELAADSRPRR